MYGQSDIEVLHPEPIIIRIRRAQGAIETLEILPLPARKWGRGLAYISRIAPLFGFQLENVGMGGLEDLAEQPNLDALLKLKILEAMEGENAALIYEFLAFAVDKEVSFFAGLYDETLDIAEAVVKANLSFFVERLLPRIREGIAEIRELIVSLREPQMPMITSWLIQ